jgi:transcriptional regulator with XRE-family HTH domain
MIKKSSNSFPATVSYGAVLGYVIAAKRQSLEGVHQKSLADALGITQSAYSRLESGQSAVNPGQLRRIAICLKTTPGELVKQTDAYIENLTNQGVEVTDQKPDNIGGMLIGLGILAAILATAGR